MPKLPRITPRHLIGALKRAGFVVDHVTGSHYFLYHQAKDVIVTIAYHNRDLKLGTLRSILRQADLKTQELIDLL